MVSEPSPAGQFSQSALGPISGVLAFRKLLWQFTLRNVEVRHRGSHLGLIWSIAGPLLMLAVYTYVFGFIFGGSFGKVPNESRWDFGLAIFLSLSVFHLFTETLSTAPAVIAANPNFVKKVVFPLEVLPAASVGASVIHFLITLGLVFVGVFALGSGLTWHVFLLPVVIVPVLLMCLGMSWAVSALCVFWRDVAQFVPAACTVLLFASAVFYSSDKIPREGWQRLLLLNPVLQCIDQARNVVLWHHVLDLDILVYLYVWGLLATFVGSWLFARLRPGFADVL